MKVSLPQIRHEQSGFEAVVRHHAQTKDCRLTRIEIDMSVTDWFDADMCAAFGSILYRLSHELKESDIF